MLIFILPRAENPTPHFVRLTPCTLNIVFLLCGFNTFQDFGVDVGWDHKYILFKS